MSTIPQKLYNEFFEIVERGNERELKDFLTKNFKEFPKDLRDDIIMALFEEALSAQQEKSEAVASLKKDGMETLMVMERVKNKLEDRKKLIELKEKI